MFKTRDNVPEIYVDKSRDFQLLCRLKDLIQGGVKYNIDSLRHTSNTLEINNTLLPLLKSKLGFFEQDELDETQLRYLLNAFPYIVRNKGSKRGIEYAVYLWFRMYQLRGELLDINIDNDNYEIIISIETLPTSTAILDAVFKYILPTGYIVTYNFAKSYESKAEYTFNDNVKIEAIDPTENSILNTEIQYTENTKQMLSAVGLTHIPIEPKENKSENE